MLYVFTDYNSYLKFYCSAVHRKFYKTKSTHFNRWFLYLFKYCKNVLIL